MLRLIISLFATSVLLATLLAGEVSYVHWKPGWFEGFTASDGSVAFNIPSFCLLGVWLR